LTAAQVSWRISNDGRQLFATVRGAGVNDPGQAILVAPDGGQAQLVSTDSAVAARSAMMTPGGETVAWVEGTNRLITVATANPGAPQELTVNAPLVEGAAMIDSSSYVVRVRDGVGTAPASLSRVTATATTPLGIDRPLQIFVSQYVPAVSTKLLFYSLNQGAQGQHDLWLLDLTVANAKPVQLAAQVEAPIGLGIFFSDDGTMIHYLDNYDPTTRRGDAFVVSPASPSRNLVATGIRELSFEPGSTRMMYISGPDASTDAGVLTLQPSLEKPPLVEGVGEVNFIDTRTSPARTYFTQETGGHDDGVWYMSEP
jgi:hypothetical protein